MRKCLGALPFCLALLFAFQFRALAAQNVANTNQKGSLMNFPKIDVRQPSPGVQRDTIIRISNDYPVDVSLYCTWVNSEFDKTDFIVGVPPSGTIWFRASDGSHSLKVFSSVAAFPMPFQTNPYTGQLKAATGELTCFAVDSDTWAPISFNHLFGAAEIFENESILYGYPSWNFTARGVELGKQVGRQGRLLLTGKEGGYDACPDYLTTEFQPALTSGECSDDCSTGTELTLVACKQDLRQDGSRIVTKALFEIFDQNGTKFGNAWKCINKFDDDFLQNTQPKPDPWTGLLVGAYGGANFTVPVDDMENARMRISAVKSTECEASNYNRFWRDTHPYPNAPTGIPGTAIDYYNNLGMGPKGSSRKTSFLSVIVKHNPDGGLFAKTPCTAGADTTGIFRYDPPRAVVPE